MARITRLAWMNKRVYLTTFPVAGILPFRPPGFGSYSLRASASYSFEAMGLWPRCCLVTTKGICSSLSGSNVGYQFALICRQSLVKTYNFLKQSMSKSWAGIQTWVRRHSCYLNLKYWWPRPLGHLNRMNPLKTPLVSSQWPEHCVHEQLQIIWKCNTEKKYQTWYQH